MTTLVRPDERTDDAGSPPSTPHEPGRLDAWRSTWSVALRMARRDVRRHRGRSALTVIMVLVPTTLLSALVTFATTSDVAGTELIPVTMGNGQALLESPDSLKITQGVTSQNGYSSGPAEATPIPGFDREANAFDNADAVSQLVGAPVSPIVTFPARVTVGDRRLTVDVTALDGSVGLGERLELTSGRWPTTATEVLVTPGAAARGVPTTGTLTTDVNGTASTLTVVGSARAGGLWSEGGLVVSAPLPGAQGSSSWIVRGDKAVTWEDVRRLNGYGFGVTSAAVLRDPPTEAQLTEAGANDAVAADNELRLMVALGAVMLLTTCTLLVGPAFAVSAARQRRTLALAASNGATTAVLRRTVLSQALVLGGFSAVVGPLLGIAGAYGVILWTRRDGTGIQAPFDVRPGLLSAIALCALASTVVAALVPARRLGRLDIVGVMRGQSVSPRPSPWLFVTGLVLAAAGSALLVTATGAMGRAGQGSTPVVLGMSPDYVVVIGAIALILGSLFLVPLILAGTGRLGGLLPTSLRMAARDLARHRARSAPSVAAVLAAVAGLTFGLTGLESDTEQRRMEYLPTTIPGEAVVSPGYQQQPDLELVRSTVPTAVVSENRIVDIGDPWASGQQPTEPFRMTFVNIVPDGCTPEQTLGYYASTEPDDDTLTRCARLGTTGATDGSVLVLPADELVRRLRLDATDAAAVRAGAVVVRGIDASSVRLVKGTFAQDPQATGPVNPDVQVDLDRTVPAVVVPNTKEDVGRMLGTGIAVAADTPLSTGWETTARNLTVRHADGRAVTQDEADRLQERVGDDSYVQVERGFQREDRLVVGILLGVFALLILTVTLTSTALTLAEQQTDQATLAALGATRGTRRVMAAGQAFLLAAVGCVLGVAVGLVPGIAIAKPLTSDSWDPLTGQSVATEGVLVIPWVTLGILGILIPVVAATLAAAGIRRAPQVTRRAT